jgi:hypothetical protein
MSMCDKVLKTFYKWQEGLRLADGELNKEWCFPLVGYYPVGFHFGYNLKLIRRGAVANPGSNLTVGFKQGEVELQASRQGVFGGKDSVSLKLQSVTLQDFQNALIHRSFGPLRTKLLGVEANLGMPPVGPVEWVAGVEWSLLPLLLKFEITPLAAKMFGPEFSGKGLLQMNFGPSPAGWTELGKRAGIGAIKLAFQQQGAAAALKAVIASGALAAAAVAIGTVVTSFAILDATARYSGYVSKRGSDIGVATWYGSTYAAVVAQRDYQAPNHYDPSTRKSQQNLVALAKSHALSDARRHVADKKIVHDSSDDSEVLAIFAAALGEKFGSIGTDSGFRSLRDFATDKAFAKIRGGDW